MSETAERSAAPAEAAPAAQRKRPKRVAELDLVRVLTFACVVGVHSVALSNAGSNQAAGAVLILLHFTREAFFWLTGFVLTLNYGRRKLKLARFWRRRFQLVGIPYVLWSLFYCGIARIATAGRGPTWPSGVLKDLLYGTSWYHLYFLLVSLQVYLLFPLIAALIRVTANHHAALLVVAGLVQVGLLSLVYWGSPFTGWAANLNPHQDALFWNYEFWVLAGAVAAWHIDGIRAWCSTRRPLLWVLAALALAGTIGYYAARLAAGVPTARAYAVLQPIMMVTSSAAILALFLLGVRYAALPSRSWLHRAITVASDRSFAVFLVHPFFIWLALRYHNFYLRFHVDSLPRTVIVYVFAVLGSVVVAEVVRRSPLSLVLAGRPMIRWWRSRTA